MSWLLADPLIIPFGTAVLALLFRNSPRGRWIAVAGSGLAVLAALLLFRQVLADGIVVGQMGNWPAPFGITLVADLLSATMVLHPFGNPQSGPASARIGRNACPTPVTLTYRAG